MKLFIGILGVALLIWGSLIYDAFSYGIVLQKFWTWFIVSSFNFQAITQPQSIGIVMIAYLLRGQRSKSTDNDDEDKSVRFWTSFLITVITPWALLGVGWIIHSFFF